MGRHRKVVERVWLPTRATVLRAARSRTALAASALTCLALAAIAGETGGSTAPTLASNPAVSTPNATVAGFADVLGSLDRQVGGTTASDVLDPASAAAVRAAADHARQEQEAAAQAAAEAAAAAQAAWLAAHPTPVAGLDQTQMDNALKIVQAGQAMGLGKRAFVIAIATAMQESNLYNLASTAVPSSYNYAHDGTGSDHDSVGLFQQRPSAGWGAVSQLMDPGYAATAFYRVLVTVPGWDTMPLTFAAQRVQVSAFPYAYAKHEARAQTVVDALAP